MNFKYPKLPSGYAELTYIESNDSQYTPNINTGISGNNNNLKFKIKYQWTQLPGSGTYRSIFGNRIDEETNSWRVLQFGNSITYINVNNKTGRATSYVGERSANTIYVDELDRTEYKTNGVTQPIANLDEGTTNNGNIILPQSTSGASSLIKIYYFMVWDNSTLIQNLIPCQRLSDNAVGMYDLVTNTFFGNAGTGSFGAGDKLHYEKALDLVQGINLWNEKLESGAISTITGGNTSNVNTKRSVDYTDIKPNTIYYANANYANDIVLFFYDSEKQLITKVSGDNNYIITGQGTFTSPSNAKYFRFYTGNAHTANICINLSNPDINGHYYPYAKGVKRITEVISGEIIWQTEADKLRMELAEQLGIDYVDTDTVDLGSLDWTYSSGVFSATITDGKPQPSADMQSLILCSKYTILQTNSSSAYDGENKVCWQGFGVYMYVRIRDNTYNDATAFKNANNGVLLAYEKS